MPYITQYENQQEIHIHYEVVGTGEPIVFHHGNGNCIKDWYTLGFVEALQAGFQLILIDSRGYGKSSKPHDPAAYTLHKRATDTVLVLDELGVSKVHCLGASVGASVCMMLARYYPERFKSYIFATPYFWQFDETLKQALLKGTAAYVAALEDLLQAKIAKEEIRQTFLANDAKAVWAANSSEWFDYREYVSYVKAPSLIYVGDKEPTVNELRILAQQLPDNELHILPNTDHAQAYWGSSLVTPLIRNFVRRVTV